MHLEQKANQPTTTKTKQTTKTQKNTYKNPTTKTNSPPPPTNPCPPNSKNNCKLDLLSALVSYSVISISLNPNRYRFSFLLAMIATSTGKSWCSLSKWLQASFPDSTNGTFLVIQHLYLSPSPQPGNELSRFGGNTQPRILKLLH